jgi:inorganic pyrophosphatase
MVNYLELPIGDRAPEVFRAVIEIPKDGTQKFEYDKDCTSSSWTATCIRRCTIRATTALFPRH